MIARVDQWLWACRLFKTRTQATAACRSGKVLLEGQAVKPAHPIKPGDALEVRGAPISRTYRVKGVAIKRVSAARARELVEETTPAADLEKLELFRRDPLNVVLGLREKGSGRPTKRERRQLDKLRKF